MRVISAPTPLRQRLYRAFCRICHHQIEFTFGEATYRVTDHGEKWLHIDCPLCKSRITVDAWGEKAPLVDRSSAER